MHTFHTISKKIIDIENGTLNNIHKINYFIFIQREYSTKNKYIFLNETLNNIFSSEQIREVILENFNKIQKIYYGFSRLAHIYKYKKAKIIIDTDLIMNPIDVNSKYTFCLYQNNYKYLFNIHELIKIIHNSTANSINFFNNSIPIKNPYNNIIFNKSTLYNIYFFIKMNTLLHSEIFYYFFKVNFNLNKFVKEYEHILRDFSIETYLNNSSKETLRDDITMMLDDFNYMFVKNDMQIIIHHEFPIDKLIEILKPYLKLYLLSHYSFIYIIREKSKKRLIQELNIFKKYNPLFGRKIMKINNNNSFTISFNMDHISFYKNENIKDMSNFMINHCDKFMDEDEGHQDNDNHHEEHHEDNDDDEDDIR